MVRSRSTSAAAVRGGVEAVWPVPSDHFLRRALYVHYVRAIVLLAECQPYVDDPDLRDSVDELMSEVSRGGTLTCRRNTTQWEVALPEGPGR